MIKHHLQDYIPFMLATGSTQPSFSTVRIIEALLIAGLTAAGTGYITQAVMENELHHLSIAEEQNRAAIKDLDDTLSEHLQWELDRATMGTKP